MGGRVAGNTTAYGYDDSDRLTSAMTENPLTWSSTTTPTTTSSLLTRE